jgi:hypothetical protein
MPPPTHTHTQTGSMFARFEVFMVVTIKNGVFWNIKPSSYLTGDTLRLRYRAQPVNVM